MKDLDSYISKSKEYLQRREDRLLQIPQSEITSTLGAPAPEIDTPKDVLYPDLSNDEEKFYSFTGYTTDEFNHLLAITCQMLVFQGRGRKAKISEKDTLIILLHYIRRYPIIEEFATMLSITSSSLERLLERSIDALSDYLFRKLVQLPAETEELPLDPNFPEASLIVDATVQRINMPGMTFDERKPWYSGKHHFYCLKSQVVVNMKGIAIHVKTAVQGAVHDLEVFRSTLPEIETILRINGKKPQKVLADKGYISDIPILLTPHKGSNLTRAQMLENDRIAKHRIVIENFYGRLKSRYSIIGSKYRGAHDNYERIFKLCIALTNFEMIYCKHYLRKSDGDWYSRFRASELIEMKNRSIEKAEIRKEARLRRIARFGRPNESD